MTRGSVFIFKSFLWIIFHIWTPRRKRVIIPLAFLTAQQYLTMKDKKTLRIWCFQWNSTLNTMFISTRSPNTYLSLCQDPHCNRGIRNNLSVLNMLFSLGWGTCLGFLCTPDSMPAVCLSEPDLVPTLDGERENCSMSNANYGMVSSTKTIYCCKNL